MRPNYPVLAWGILGILALIWGSSFILIKKGLMFLTPDEVGALRIAAASLFVVPFAIPRIKRVQRSQWKHLFSVGLAGSLIPAFLFAFAQTKLPSSVTGVLNALTPLFTILIGWTAFSARPGKRVYIGIAIGFIGTAILILATNSDSLSINQYAFLVIAATILYGFNVNMIKYHLHGLSSVAITSISLTLVGPFAIIYLFVSTGLIEKIYTVDGTMFAASYILLLGIFGTAIALIIFNRLVQITDPIFAASVTYIIPLVAVMWGLLDGEILGGWHFAGITGIIWGVWVANKPSKLKNKLKDEIANDADHKA